MTRQNPLWQQADSYPAGVDRLLLGALWPTVATRGAVVTTVAATMNVQIAPGTVAVPLQAGQGSALCAWDANEVVTLAGAPPSGQSRVDLVCVQVRDNTLDGGGNNDFVMAAVTGTPAASNPVTPAVPTNAAALYSVLVPGGVANLNTATLTDLRGGGLAVVKGFASGVLGADFATVGTYTTWLTTVPLAVGRWLVHMKADLYNTTANPSTVGIQLSFGTAAGVINGPNGASAYWAGTNAIGSMVVPVSCPVDVTIATPGTLLLQCFGSASTKVLALPQGQSAPIKASGYVAQQVA